MYGFDNDFYQISCIFILINWDNITIYKIRSLKIFIFGFYVYVMMKILVNYMKSEGQYIAQCVNNPEIITVAKKKSDLGDQIVKIISGYVKAFPKYHKKIISDGSMDFEIKLVENKKLESM